MPIAQFSEDTTLSVAEFIAEINVVIKPLRRVVVGEVTKITNRGHVYFTIKDKNEPAVMDCILWQSKYQNLGFELEEGTEVKVFGAANIYPNFGKFSFIADHVLPVGEGMLQKLFEALKKRLAEAGYFDEAHKMPLPPHPQRIGLITSKGGDAIRDFTTHLGKCGYTVMHYDVKVEGIKAVDSIIDAFNWFNQHPDSVEVIVLTRGGGSLESLQAFNSEQVAKVIYSSKIPVVSAIGHENDWTIADYVADVRASTPTHAGRILLHGWAMSREKIQTVSLAILSYTQHLLSRQRDLVSIYQENILSQFERALHQRQRYFEQMNQQLLQYVQQRLRIFKQTQEMFLYSFVRLERSLSHYSKQLQQFTTHISAGFLRQSRQAQQDLHLLEQKLQLSDPRLRLKQGYSIAFGTDGKVLRSIRQAQAGEKVRMQLSDGEVLSVVESIKEHHAKK